MTTIYETMPGTKWTYGESRHGVMLYGPCPVCGSACGQYGGGWRCLSLYCCNSFANGAPTLGAPPKWWDTGVRVYKDGGLWCAVGPNFENLQESEAGFGETPQQAVDRLIHTPHHLPSAFP